jgi:hypothetical protein
MGIRVASQERFNIELLKRSLWQEHLKVVVAFFSVDMLKQTPTSPVASLKQAFPDAVCVGISSYGGYSQDWTGDFKGLWAMSLSASEVEECIAVKGTHFRDNAMSASIQLAADFQRALGNRTLNRDEWLGLLFVDGVSHGEALTTTLTANPALKLTFAGAAAADNLSFTHTVVCLDKMMSTDGVVLLALKMKIPFHVTHSVHFAGVGASFMVTSADTTQRTISGLDLKPADAVYAASAHIPLPRLKETLPAIDFAFGVVGRLTGGSKALLLRAPAALEEGNALRLLCGVPEGRRVYLLQATSDIIDTTARSVESAIANLGHLKGAIHFNCALREEKIRKARLEKDFRKTLAVCPFICCNSFGQIGLGAYHNQTLLSVFFGA